MSPSSTESPTTGSRGGMRERLRNSPRLIPDTSWTLVNNFFSVASGLVVFKIISRWISASEYGQASLVMGVAGLLNQMIASPSTLAHMRLYFGHAKEGRGNAYRSAVLRLLLWTAVVMSGVYLGITGLYAAAGDRVYWSLALPAILLLFTQSQLSAALGFLEVQKQYRKLTFAQSLSKVLQVPALLFLIFASVSHPSSVVYSLALAQAFVVIVWSAVPAMRTDQREAPFELREISTGQATFSDGHFTYSIFSVGYWRLQTATSLNISGRHRKSEFTP